MNATLIDSKPVAIPEMTLNMARRNMPADDFARYAAVQMYQITYRSEGLIANRASLDSGHWVPPYRAGCVDWRPLS
jgi:hypothetical protein